MCLRQKKQDDYIWSNYDAPDIEGSFKSSLDSQNYIYSQEEYGIMKTLSMRLVNKTFMEMFGTILD